MALCRPLKFLVTNFDKPCLYEPHVLHRGIVVLEQGCAKPLGSGEGCFFFFKHCTINEIQHPHHRVFLTLPPVSDTKEDGLIAVIFSDSHSCWQSNWIVITMLQVFSASEVNITIVVLPIHFNYVEFFFSSHFVWTKMGKIKGKPLCIRGKTFYIVYCFLYYYYQSQSSCKIATCSRIHNINSCEYTQLCQYHHPHNGLFLLINLPYTMCHLHIHLNIP